MTCAGSMSIMRKPGIGLLVLDDHPQGGIELLVRGQALGRLGDGALVVLPFPHHEAVEQIPLGGEPAIQRRPRHPGLQGDLREAQLRHAVSAEYLRGRGQDALTRRVVVLDDRILHRHSFTNLRRNVTLNCDSSSSAGP